MAFRQSDARYVPDLSAHPERDDLCGYKSVSANTRSTFGARYSFSRRNPCRLRFTRRRTSESRSDAAPHGTIGTEAGDKRPHGLQHATNLKRLFLSGNRLSDVSPIANLTNLTTLSLSSNSLSDIHPLANLTNLKHLFLRLFLSKNRLSDVSPIAGLTNLTTLSLSSNSLSDIHPLANLTNLKRLFLSKNRLSDVSPIAGLTNLTTLSLSSNSLSDIHPLEGLTQLTNLFLSKNSISDVSPLEGLTQLTTLRLSKNRLSDVSALSNLTQLTTLWLSGNPMLDTSPIYPLTENKLTDVDIEVSLEPPLVRDTRLAAAIREELDLPADALLSVEAMQQLTELSAHYHQISDITGLEHATNLTELDLSFNKMRHPSARKLDETHRVRPFYQ